ncbi:hypothetical protein LTR08_003713 [Meristemomyces frigidus]|nr:hypothetical protein LTR08_003713 [Meristemomyces frigidus]
MAAAADDEAWNAWCRFGCRTRMAHEVLKVEDAPQFAITLAPVWITLSAPFRASIRALIEEFDSSDKALTTAREDRDKIMKEPYRIPPLNATIPEIPDDGKSTIQNYVASVKRLIQALERHVDALERLQAALDTAVFPNGFESSSRFLAERITAYKAELSSAAIIVARKEQDLKDRRDALNPVLEKRRNRNGFGPSWVGTWLIGAGSFGAANLWLKQNPDGVIADRMVVKGTNLSTKPGSWRGLTMVDPTNPQRRVPTEAWTMMKLRSCEGAPESIVRLRNWNMNSDAQKYMLYLEWCPFGDLESLIKRYVRIRGNYSRFLQGRCLEPSESRFIPEPFLWHCFEAMAIAGTLLERGELDSAGTNFWDLIVHRDWKLNNCFLATPLEKRYKGYPAPKLADFGLACVIPKDPSRLPTRLGTCGTRGTRAVEQVLEPKTVTSATNVWSAGFQIWGLMHVRAWNMELMWEASGGSGLDEPQFGKPEREYYSAEIVELAEECLRFLKKDRITFTDLLQKIRDHADLSGLRLDKDANDAGFRTDMGEFTDKWAAGSLLCNFTRLPDKLGGMGGMPEPPTHSDSDEPGGEEGKDERGAKAKGNKRPPVPEKGDDAPGGSGGGASPRKKPRSLPLVRKAGKPRVGSF